MDRKIHELKPCPFCNGKSIFIHDPEDMAEIAGIYCLACKAYVKWNIRPEKKETFGETQHKWAEKWNRRANDDQGADGREDHANTAGD